MLLEALGYNTLFWASIEFLVGESRSGDGDTGWASAGPGMESAVGPLG